MLAFAPHLGFEFSKVWVASRLLALSRQLLPKPASACGHYVEAFSLGLFPLLFPLSPGDLRGVASHTTSTLPPAPQVQTRVSTLTEVFHAVLWAPALSFQT